MMHADDPRHGTTRGYHQGCREDCCREARNAKERTQRKRREVLGITYAVPALGTVRRIHALMALGWRSHDLAERCGWTHGNAILEIASRTWVERKTAAKIAKLYDDLHMTPGPSKQTRTRALRNGWVPPLGWNNIDDPDDRPDLGAESFDFVTARKVNNPEAWEAAKAARMEDLEHMAASGVSTHEAARRLGMSIAGLEKWLERQGRSDLYARMKPRDHNAVANLSRNAA